MRLNSRITAKFVRYLVNEARWWVEMKTIIMKGELTKWFSLNNLKAIKNRFRNRNTSVWKFPLLFDNWYNFNLVTNFFLKPYFTRMALNVDDKIQGYRFQASNFRHLVMIARNINAIKVWHQKTLNKIMKCIIKIRYETVKT